MYGIDVSFAFRKSDANCKSSKDVKLWPDLTSAKEAAMAWHQEVESMLNGMESSTHAVLKAMCQEADLPKTGNKADLISKLVPLMLPTVPEPHVSKPEALKGTEITEMYLRKMRTAEQIAQIVAVPQEGRNPAATAWISNVVFNTQVLKDGCLVFLLGAKQKPFKTSPSQVAIASHFWPHQAGMDSAFADVSLDGVQEFLANTNQMAIQGWGSFAEDLHVAAIHLELQACIQKQEPDAFGVLFNSKEQTTAFRLDAACQPTTVEIHIEKRGRYSKGWILNEAVMATDPKRQLGRTMDRPTSLAHMQTRRCSAGKRTWDPSVAAMPAEVDVCPDGSPQEQAIWYIDMLLKTSNGKASMKAVMFHLAKHKFKGHSEAFVKTYFRVDEDDQKQVYLEKPEEPQEKQELIELPEGDITFEPIMIIAQKVPGMRDAISSLMMTRSAADIQSANRRLVADRNNALSSKPTFETLTRHGPTTTDDRHLFGEAKRMRLARLEKKALDALFFPQERPRPAKNIKAAPTKTVGDVLKPADSTMASAVTEGAVVAEAAQRGGEMLRQKKGKKNCAAIFKKMQIIDYTKTMPASCTSGEMATMVAFPESLTSVGMLGCWKRAAALYQWHLLPIDISKKAKEIPNWLRLSLRINGQKGMDENSFCPMICW